MFECVYCSRYIERFLKESWFLKKMEKTIEECVKENKGEFAKSTVINDNTHYYCPSNIKGDCFYQKHSNNVPDNNGDMRPICRLRIAYEKSDN